MSKNKFHIDKPLPDAEQINRHKDFGRLYARYESATRFRFWRRLLRRPRLFGSVVLLAVVVWLVYEAGREGASTTEPRYEPQMAWAKAFDVVKTDSGNCEYRVLNTLDAFFAAGIPLHMEANGEAFLMQADQLIECRSCDALPMEMRTGSYFIWDKETAQWRDYTLSGRLDTALLLSGKKTKMPPANERKIRLRDEQGKNLSRQLGMTHRRVFLLLPKQNSLLPIAYDGEGRHILPFVPEKAAIWTVDADGQWWEGAEAPFDRWRDSEEVDFFVKKRRVK